MFKFGIYDQKRLNIEHIKSFWGKRQFIAQDLYDRLDDHSTEEQIYLQEKILNRLSVSNGVFKFTSSERFNDFDQKVIETVQEHFEADQPLKVHDMGISDGRTSAPLFKHLYKIFGTRLDCLASDYAPYLFSVCKNGSANRIIINENNELMQVVFPPFVFFTVHPESKVLYPLNFVVRKFVENCYAKPLLQKYIKGNDSRIVSRKVTLLCPDFQALLKKYQTLRFEQQDIMNMPDHKYNVIRVMNLLNKAYFSDSFLQAAVQNVIASLHDGGLFIVGSNKEQGTVVEGGIYQKQGDTMIRLYQSGQDGAAVEPWILDEA